MRVIARSGLLMPRLIGRAEVRSLTQRAPLFSQHPPSGQLIAPRRSGQRNWLAFGRNFRTLKDDEGGTGDPCYWAV